MQDARVLLLDDIMHTGCTMKAAQDLVNGIPGVEVAATFTIYEILNQRGAKKLSKQHVSAIKIESLKQIEEK